MNLTKPTIYSSVTMKKRRHKYKHIFNGNGIHTSDFRLIFYYCHLGTCIYKFMIIWLQIWTSECSLYLLTGKRWETAIIFKAIATTSTLFTVDVVPFLRKYFLLFYREFLYFYKYYPKLLKFLNIQRFAWPYKQ